MAAVAGPSPVVAVPLTAVQQVDAVRSGDVTETPRAIEALEQSARSKPLEEERSSLPQERSTTKSNKDSNNQSSEAGKADTAARSQQQELTLVEQQQVEKLAQRDREVRQHELAHQAAAGQHGGAIKLQYTVGPDGRRYAVSGSVQVDLSREATAEATLEKAEQIKRAALAPAEPSGQDRLVAQQATMMAMAARAEMLREERTEQSELRAEQVEKREEVAEQAEAQKEEAGKSYQQRFDDLTATLLELEKYRDELSEISERFNAIA